LACGLGAILTVSTFAQEKTIPTFTAKNDVDAYSFNNITAKKNDDGSVTVQFGPCDGKTPKLSADHARLELHGASLSPAERNPRRNLEVSGSAAAMIYFQEKAIHKEFMRRHGAST